MIKKIIQKIKSEIASRLISVPFKGQEKKVIGPIQWWDPGFKFETEIDLASIPVNGPITTNVQFSCWTNVEMNLDYKKKASINANFGPIHISFKDSDYQVDCSDAKFFLFEIE